MKCNKCKEIIDDKNIKFCPKCGNDLVLQTKKHKKIMIISAIAITICIAIISAYVIISNLPCKHKNWIEATCDSPKTCAKCGYTEGSPLEHDYADATCTKPQKCKLCGQTEGEALGHDFQGGSCEEESVCARCQEITPPSGHECSEATCTEPAKCQKCGKVCEPALGHNYVGNSCSRCGAKNTTERKENRVVYSSGGLVITYLGYEYEEGQYGDFKLNFRIDNNSGYEECIQMRDESINGYMCDFTMSDEVLNGKSALADASIGHYKLKDVGLSDFSQIKTIQFKFIKCESNYALSPTITLNIN